MLGCRHKLSDQLLQMFCTDEAPLQAVSGAVSCCILDFIFPLPRRHVVLPQEIAKCLPKGVLLSEVSLLIRSLL